MYEVYRVDNGDWWLSVKRDCPEMTKRCRQLMTGYEMEPADERQMKQAGSVTDDSMVPVMIDE